MKRLFLTLVTALFVAGVAAADNRPGRFPDRRQQRCRWPASYRQTEWKALL